NAIDAIRNFLHILNAVTSLSMRLFPLLRMLTFMGFRLDTAILQDLVRRNPRAASFIWERSKVLGQHGQQNIAIHIIKLADSLPRLTGDIPSHDLHANRTDCHLSRTGWPFMDICWNRVNFFPPSFSRLGMT